MFRGIRPSYYKIYDGGVPNYKRVDQVLDWLALPEERAESGHHVFFNG